MNEVALFTKEMYEEELEQKEIQIKECIKEYNQDREDFVHEDKDGNFYTDLDDYDYQYRILTK